MNCLAVRVNTERPAFERAAIQKDWEEWQEWGEQVRLKGGDGADGGGVKCFIFWLFSSPFIWRYSKPIFGFSFCCETFVVLVNHGR